MRARFEFDPAAWATPEARHVVETLASLMETPARLAPPGTPPDPDEASVFVGAPAAAPAAAVVVIAVDGWPRWEPRSLTLARIAGEPLPAPSGTPSTPREDRVLPAAWLRAAGMMLQRDEETLDERRDQWSCYSGVFSRANDLGILDRASLNSMARDLTCRLQAHARASGATLEPRPMWPDGAPFAAVLSHDVDDVTLLSARMAWRLLRQASGADSYAFRAGLSGMARALARPRGAPDPYWSFDRWISEEERRGFRSSWYFTPPRPSRRHEYDALYVETDRLRFEGRLLSVADLMSTLRERGHEIGLHGSYLSHEDGDELARQREQIASASGSSVDGIRQHFLRFSVRSTWRAQRRAGFGYDSTLGYNEAIGFRAGIAAPFRPWDAGTRAPLDQWELPLTLMDGTLFRTLKLDADRAVDRVRLHLDEVQRVGGLAVLLWHPNSADDRRFPGWWTTYLAVLDELARRGAWVATAEKTVKWWRARHLPSPSERALC